MNFAPTETQRLLVSSFERLLSDRFDFRTRSQHLRGSPTPPLWAEFATLGLLGIEIDESFGGSAGTFEDMAMALQPLGAALVVDPFIPCVVVAAGLLATMGTSTQKAEWLPRIADGALRASFAHGERRARDTLPWVETTARRDGSGWRLDGMKIVSLGGHCADLFLVSARTRGVPSDHEGISVFAVPAVSEGLVIQRYTLYDGSGAADLKLAGVTLPDTALMGTLDRAYEWVALAHDRGAAAVCAESIGVMTSLHDLTLEYLKSREQFGRSIGQFQVLQHRMADVYMAVELARSMALYAIAALADPDPTSRANKISAAKVAIGRACREVGQSCIQLHGGIGLTEEYPAGHYFKRLTMLERLFGDPEHHLRRYARLNA